MTGWNMPPGVNECDIPGNRPEDAAWEKYWDTTDRPDNVYGELYPDAIPPDDLYDLYDLYEKDLTFACAIDKDFEVWWDEQNDWQKDYQRDE